MDGNGEKLDKINGKFRAWHKSENEMCQVKTLTDKGAFLVGIKMAEDIGGITAPEDGRFCTNLEFILMRNTMRFDKNDKAVYEFDIVKDSLMGVLTVIEWDDQRSGFYLNPLKSHMSNRCHYIETLEKIGEKEILGDLFGKIEISPPYRETEKVYSLVKNSNGLKCDLCGYKDSIVSSIYYDDVNKKHVCDICIDYGFT